MTKFFLVAVVMLLVVVIPVATAVAQTPDHEGHSEEGDPVPAQPPGERNPVIGIIAAATILVVGAAGIFIYRVIKEGI